jgi:hypothetical protein
MKNIFKYMMLMIIVGLFSCDDPGTDIVVGGKAFLELDRAGQPNPTAALTYTQSLDGQPIRYRIQVNIMGRPQGSATNVTYDINTASTAVAGTHYNLVSTAGTITIPAGENLGFIDIDILDDSWNPLGASGTKDLIIEITGGDLPLSKYLKATYRIRVN